jgi:TniB protein
LAWTARPWSDESGFFGAILDQLGSPYALSERVCRRQDAAIQMMRETSLGLLIIDDVQNILAGTRLQQRRLLNPVEACLLA